MALSRAVYGQVPSRTQSPSAQAGCPRWRRGRRGFKLKARKQAFGPPPETAPQWGLRVEAEGEDAGLSSSRLPLKAEG